MRDEIEAGHALRPARRSNVKLGAVEVPNTMTRGPFPSAPKDSRTRNPATRVRTKNIHPATHTALPRYARDRRSASSKRCAAVTSFPTPPRSARARIRNGLYNGAVEGPRNCGGESAESSLKVSIEALSRSGPAKMSTDAAGAALFAGMTS